MSAEKDSVGQASAEGDPKAPKTLLEKVTNTQFVKHSDGSVLVCVHQDSGKTKGKQISFLGAPDKIRELYEVVFDFAPSSEDEIALKTGQIVSVTEIMIDGWYRGKNMETKLSGVFPGNYVKKIEIDETKKK
ncbi:SH3 domain-containing RING finger protein 3-like [Oopsacas minuta]|uniref:SH3 domain-containing RING finger protein 3-like n=1 Tax=Oopsacas minuta TaxID=111878 RepID=A0AAV7JZY6_9METZ|nr:SH3 domain-containing RING finger protein 3-like [Oopsacas minuta]